MIQGHVIEAMSSKQIKMRAAEQRIRLAAAGRA
jgi:hypothetical protein